MPPIYHDQFRRVTASQSSAALDAPQVSFLTIDPTLLDPRYHLTLREFERARIRAADEQLMWLVILTVTRRGISANLGAPIVINSRWMLGCQFIRDDSDYPIRFLMRPE